jgi:hypothetical protein
MREIWSEILLIDSSKRALRSFGLVVGGVCLAIAAVLFWRHGWIVRTPETWFGAIGLGLVFMGLTFPRALKPLHIVWMTLALILGFIMTRVILSIVFFGMMTPIGLIRRALGKDPMRNDATATRATYWIAKGEPAVSPKRLEKLY